VVKSRGLILVDVLVGVVILSVVLLYLVLSFSRMQTTFNALKEQNSLFLEASNLAQGVAAGFDVLSLKKTFPQVFKSNFFLEKIGPNCFSLKVQSQRVVLFCEQTKRPNH